ncbi:hypothetical protein DM01DRAFT_1310336 [Hesseltinella vesiculosa]|uniref:Cyclase n=1 Tax=Hesseltinella vesiculosa TaxID=101127 RepID=A0A1X2G861_9FUNG|nr:hypothetical protein DM01DRAFT_1310336 [Hesseltinella vesiculosa]
MSLPSYDQLPIDPKYPPHTAWGLWGDDDNLGTLNKITKQNTVDATKLVKHGKIFPLNWALESPRLPMFGRPAIEHRLPCINNVIFDDIYDNYNPQSSSQWDGLSHVAHIASGKFYNGVTVDELGPDGNGRLGIHHMARHGIATRAVLLDYARWAKTNRPDFDPYSSECAITVNELDEVAKAQNVTFKSGDILLVRIGWIAKYNTLTDDEFKAAVGHNLDAPTSAGLKACPETYKWIWDHHFAAVGGDQVAWEVFPPQDWAHSCHSNLIGGFGMPLGELLFLEKLAEDCDEDKVYEFLLTSAPNNKYRGVGTSPNAVCIK